MTPNGGFHCCRCCLRLFAMLIGDNFVADINSIWNKLMIITTSMIMIDLTSDEGAVLCKSEMALALIWFFLSLLLLLLILDAFELMSCESRNAYPKSIDSKQSHIMIAIICMYLNSASHLWIWNCGTQQSIICIFYHKVNICCDQVYIHW